MKWDIQTAVILVCILVALALGSPSHSHDATQPALPSTQCSNEASTLESTTSEPSIHNDFESIAHALGCIFAPQTCKAKN